VSLCIPGASPHPPRAAAHVRACPFAIVIALVTNTTHILRPLTSCMHCGHIAPLFFIVYSVSCV